MGNQLTGEAPLVIYPVEHYLQDMPNYEFDSSLGSTRFFKVARARCKEGLVVVRVFVIQDPTSALPLKEHQDRLDVIYKSLKNQPNCLPFQKHLRLERAAILIRQYLKFNLYDRLSTRPFLTLLEKKWIAFQLLCALNQSHKLKVCHGDIKAENILLTGWNWTFLTDYASFKPVMLPYDDPSDYSYFFDTSRRRVCYIAPERFVGKPSDGSTSSSSMEESHAVYKELTPAMDIFSAGCVITEMFCDGVPPFDLSQLLQYSTKNYSPQKLIDSIPDNSIKELVEHMLQRKPEYRLSAEEYLIKQRGKAFPDFFYSFFKSYSQQFATMPIMPSDDRIMTLYRDIENILGSMAVEERREKNEKLVLVISLVTSVCRDLHFSSYRRMALNLLLKLSSYVTSEIILDRILPYVLFFTQDPLPEVRSETIRVVTECVKNLTTVPNNDSNVFQDYIIPTLSPLLSDDVLQVRLTFAENIAELADTAVNYLNLAQAQELRAVLVQFKTQQQEHSGTSISESALNVKKSTEEMKPEIQQVESSYDMELQQLKDLIHQKIFQLLSDPNHAVKMSLMSNGMNKLCLFFGRQKANDILVSHIVTFLNVKDDWRLRACFFKTVVEVTMFVGWQCSEVLLPLLQQGLSDTEEFVLMEDLRALKLLTQHRLLNKTMMHTLVCDASPLLAHPGPWVRQAAVGFVTAVAQAYDIPDIFCKLSPQVQPFLTRTVGQLRRPEILLDALDKPIPREVFDYLLRFSHLEAVFEVLVRQKYIKTISQKQRTSYPELDEPLSQAFRKLTSLGMTDSVQVKLLHMKDFLLKLHKNRAGSVELVNQTPMPMRKVAGMINAASLGRMVTRRHADLHKLKPDYLETTASISGKTTKKVKKQDSVVMNPEWKKMFGSDESDVSSLSTSPKSNLTTQVFDGSAKSPLTPSGLPQSLSPTPSLASLQSSVDNVSQVSTLTSDSFQRSVSGPVALKPDRPVNRYAKCKWELRDLVHHRRRQFDSDCMSTNRQLSLESEVKAVDSWKPKGILVAHLQEHKSAINRLSLSSDHRFFASCSDDGSVRLWETSKLEGKTAANRSKLCLNKQGGCIKSVTFLQGSSSLATASDNNTINVYRIDSGAVTLDKTQTVDTSDYGLIMDMNHYDTGSQSLVTYATVSSHIFGWDLRAPGVAWKIRNDPRDGLITSYDVHQSQCWMAAGTYSGTVVCWDMRFMMPINKIHHPSGQRVRRLSMYPSEQSLYVASFNWNNELSIWDAETGSRRKTLWPSSSPPLSYHKTDRPQESEGMNGVYLGMTENKTFAVTGGCDMRLRYWDLSYPANSVCFNYGVEDSRLLNTSYRSQLIEGCEVIQEIQTHREVQERVETEREHHMLHRQPLQGHNDTINDIIICHGSQTLVISAAHNGFIKVWK